MISVRHCLVVAIAGAFPAFSALAASGLRIEAQPDGATVNYRITRPGTDKVRLPGNGTTPMSVEKFKLDKEEQLELEVRAKDHVTVKTNYAFGWYETSKPAKGEDFLIKVALERTNEMVSVRLDVSGARFMVGDRSVPAETELNFFKNRPGGAWNQLHITAEQDGYELDPLDVRLEMVKSMPQNDGRHVLQFRSSLLRSRNSLKIVCRDNLGQPREGTVYDGTNKIATISDRGVGEANVQLERSSKNDPWSKVFLRIEVPNHEWAPTNGPAQPCFDRELTFADWHGSSSLDIEAVHFQKMQVYPNIIHEFVMETKGQNLDGMSLVVSSNYYAAVEVENTSTDVKPFCTLPGTQEYHVVLARPSPVPTKGNLKRIYYAAARYDYVGTNLTALKGSVIRFVTEAGSTGDITDRPERFDTDPCVSQDGKWVYYSSLDDFGTRCITKVQVGLANYTPVAANPGYVDTEPAVSKDGRLAFTRRKKGAPLTRAPEVYYQIAVTKEGGKTPDLLEQYGLFAAGHSPAWSPDGSWIAFVNESEWLCVKEVDKAVRPTQLVSDKKCYWPAWGTDGKTIYFAAEAEALRNGARQLNLFRISVENGERTSSALDRLTSTKSLDTAPVAAPEGGEIYCLSNRGAARPLESNLGIHVVTPK